MNRIVARAAAELRTVPGRAQRRRACRARDHVGRASSSVNTGEIWVSMDPAADYDATLDGIQATVDGYPGLARSVTTYPSERVTEVFGQDEPDVVVRIYGQDLEMLQAKAGEVRAAIAEVLGVDDATVATPVIEPTVQIQVDLDRRPRSASSQATSAGPRQPAVRASRSATCSRTRRSSRSSCGDPRASARASAASRTC